MGVRLPPRRGRLSRRQARLLTPPHRSDTACVRPGLSIPDGRRIRNHMPFPFPLAAPDGAACGGVVASFDEASGAGPQHGAVARQAADPHGEPDDKYVLCAACRHRITTPDMAVSRYGGHEHVFCNPAGVVFHLVVFRNAPGCLVGWPPSMEFAWFPGHSWRIAGCRRCAAHLGWRFDDASGESFFGLIAERIITESDAG
jgi:hypothetical protein